MIHNGYQVQYWDSILQITNSQLQSTNNTLI